MPDAIATPTLSSASDSASDDALTEFIKSTTPPKKEGVPIDKPAEETVEEEVVEEEEEVEGDTKEPEVPAGFVKVPPVTEGLAAEFVVRDAEGEMEIPALTIEYKANGKVRKDRLDQVVKMAQLGVYNHEREQRYTAKEQEAAQRQQALQERIELREQQLENLLMDPDLYEEASAKFAKSNSPEQREARLRSQVQEKEQELRRQQVAVQAQQFTHGELLPALDTIAEALPEVSAEELYQRTAMFMMPMMQNGMVPPSRYGDIRHFIIEELTEWAKQTHHSRKSRFDKVSKESSKKVEKAQVDAQHAKSAVSKGMKPAGRATVKPVAKPNANPATLQEAEESAIAEVMASINRSG